MEYKFELSEKEVNTILNVLSQAQYKDVFELIANIQKQALAQVKKPMDKK